jgi:glycosyltransferase involved in cell wall biosynthesis
MSPKVRFSVVIPTRNREQTLKHTLRTCLDQIDFDDYQIVVNDNSDDSNTRILAAQLAVQDPRAKGRLRYNKRTAVCSMARNFEDAISRADGEYVIVIGDDDGLLPRALKELDALIEQTGAAVIKWSPGLYTWPNIAIPEAGNYLRLGLERAFRIANGRHELAKAQERLSHDNLPALYLNTAIRRDVVERCRDGEGHLFQSSSPGAYSAVVISYLCGDYIETTIPFTLDGLSRYSTRVSSSYAGAYTVPRADFWRLNWQDGIHHHGQVPLVPLFPVVDFADAFAHAKGHFFSADDTVVISRQSVMRACIERSDTSYEPLCQELLRACEDDAELTRFTQDLLAATPPSAKAPFKSALGSTGRQMKLDGNDFELATIRDAVNLVHKVIWPANAPLRYDLQALEPAS